MTLSDKYNHAIQTAKGFRMEGSAEERDGKLYFKGTVKNQDEANRIWDAIKTVPDWRNDIIGEIKVAPGALQLRRSPPTRSRPVTRSARSPKSSWAMPATTWRSSKPTRIS